MSKIFGIVFEFQFDSQLHLLENVPNIKRNEKKILLKFGANSLTRYMTNKVVVGNASFHLYIFLAEYITILQQNSISNRYYKSLVDLKVE